MTHSLPESAPALRQLQAGLRQASAIAALLLTTGGALAPLSAQAQAQGQGQGQGQAVELAGVRFEPQVQLGGMSSTRHQTKGSAARGAWPWRPCAPQV